MASSRAPQPPSSSSKASAPFLGATKAEETSSVVTMDHPSGSHQSVAQSLSPANRTADDDVVATPTTTTRTRVPVMKRSDSSRDSSGSRKKRHTPTGKQNQSQGYHRKILSGRAQHQQQHHQHNHSPPSVPDGKHQGAKKKTQPKVLRIPGVTHYVERVISAKRQEAERHKYLLYVIMVSFQSRD